MISRRSDWLFICCIFCRHEMRLPVVNNNKISSVRRLRLIPTRSQHFTTYYWTIDYKMSLSLLFLGGGLGQHLPTVPTVKSATGRPLNQPLLSIHNIRIGAIRWLIPDSLSDGNGNVCIFPPWLVKYPLEKFDLEKLGNKNRAYVRIRNVAGCWQYKQMWLNSGHRLNRGKRDSLTTWIGLDQVL